MNEQQIKEIMALVDDLCRDHRAFPPYIKEMRAAIESRLRELVPEPLTEARIIEVLGDPKYTYITAVRLLVAEALATHTQPAAKQAEPMARDERVYNAGFVAASRMHGKEIEELRAALAASPTQPRPQPLTELESFERWAGPITALAKKDGKYVEVMTSLAWEAWQAAYSQKSNTSS